VSSSVRRSNCIFLDTNILVYCVDPNDPQKQQICRRHLRDLQTSDRAVISTQILQEFYSVTTSKLAMPPELSRHYVSEYRLLPTVTVTPNLIDNAISLHQAHQISFWDGLVIAAASGAGCDALLTEDMNAGQIIAGVEIVSPQLFSAA